MIAGPHATFIIATGELFVTGTDGGPLVAIGTGYSGNGPALNDPTATAVKGHGPLPVGVYQVGAPIDSPTTGPYSLPLTPLPSNEMFGRGTFLIHGGLAGEPNTAPVVGDDGPRTASDGCIVAGRTPREKIAEYPLIEVLAYPESAS